MIEKLAVFNSNAVNRYGTLIPVEGLESGLQQSFDVGMPSFVSHDYHRPIAWSRGLALFIEPGIVKLVGKIISPENEKDDRDIRSAVQKYLLKKTAEFYEPYAQELEDKLKGIIVDKPIPEMASCAALVSEKLAERCFPEVFREMDSDGLVPLSLLSPIAPGVFEKDGLLLFAHQYFRRSLSRLNSMNAPFFESIEEFRAVDGLSIKISLDSDMVGLAKSYQERVELQYWWGPKFNDDLSEIELGVTTHSADDKELFFHGISRTEFWWHAQNDLKTLECEELRDIPSYGVAGERFGCRYVHSIVEPNNAQPFHFDGAIRLYEEEEMLSRLETDISKSGRHADYVKLWRVDGDLDVCDWKKILSHYYRDNSLVGEYLGGVEEGNINLHSVERDHSQKAISNYVPTDFKSGAGIRVSISYHDLCDESSSECFIRCFDTIRSGDSEIRYVDSDTLDIIKLIRKSGGKVDISDEIQFICFEDMLNNFPLIQHVGEGSVELAVATQKTIIDLCEYWSSSNHDRVVSYNIGVQYKTRNVVFSVAGHVDDLKKWHDADQSSFPRAEEYIGKWCSEVSQIVTELYPDERTGPNLDEILKLSGLILLSRSFVNPEHYSVRFDESRNGLVYDFLVEKENTSLANALTSGELSVASAFLVEESTCSKCKTIYRNCDCSKYFDPGVAQIISKSDFLGLFWTNRTSLPAVR